MGVRKSFGSQRVLDGFDLALPTGRTTVILGPSGSGKSVTLKHICGLLKPDAGEVWFRDTRVDRLSEHALGPVRQQIGLVFQMGALFDSMTVAENIAFPLIEHTRLGRAARADRVRQELRRVDLDGVQEKLPSELSGGQRKRVALARAVVLGPTVMLYDEPTTGLDPIRADGIDQLIVRLKNELGVTSLVVTHDLSSAKKVADRVVVLLSGRIAAEGTWDEIERCPDERVRRFLAGRYDHDDEADAPEHEPDEAVELGGVGS
ncbi:MAG: ATP-binding cassette domain-containing protein [Planctomycetota bacterium]